MTQTHAVTVDGSVVRKTYVSWSRDEHLREWSALQAISAAAPDLAPTPLSLSPGPTLSMSLVPGLALSGALTPVELAGLETALRRLWSLPVDGLQPLPVSALLERVRLAVASYEGADVVGEDVVGEDVGGEDVGGEGVVGRAHEAAASWLAGPEVDSLLEPAIPVIGHGDPNLSNYLWDGTTVRIIDFEDSGISDLALELANLVEHMACRDTDWTDFLNHFPVDAARLLTARRLWSTFWLTLVRPGGPSYHRNPPSTCEHQATRVLSLLRHRDTP